MAGLYAVTPGNITRYNAALQSAGGFGEDTFGKGRRDHHMLPLAGYTTRRRAKDTAFRKEGVCNKCGHADQQEPLHHGGLAIPGRGSCHYTEVLTEGLPDFGRHAGESQPIMLYIGGGYAGIVRHRGISRIPHKKPRGGKLPSAKKIYDKAHLRRVFVENVFAHIRKRRVSGRHDETAAQFNEGFNGMCPFHKGKSGQDGT